MNYTPKLDYVEKDLTCMTEDTGSVAVEEENYTPWSMKERKTTDDSLSCKVEIRFHAT